MQNELPFILPPAENREQIARGIYVEDGKDKRRILIGPARVFEYSLGDRVYNNIAIAVLLDLGCRGMDIARATDVHHNTVYRIQKNVRQLGIQALVDARDGSPGPRKVTPSIVKRIAALHKKNYNGPEIQAELRRYGSTLSLRSIYRCLHEMHTREIAEPVPDAPSLAEQSQLFASEESSEEVTKETSPDSAAASSEEEIIPEESSLGEVLLAPEEKENEVHLAVVESEIEEETPSLKSDGEVVSEPLSASPPFQPEPGKSVSYAGAFLAWPYLSLLGILPLVWRLYGELLEVKGKLYGLMQSISSFFFLTLLGFDTLEAFKVVNREGFRRLIGVVSSPTVKTLRRELGVISAFGKGYEFLMGLAKRYRAMGMLQVGVLYLDGHFIPYFGKREMRKGYYTLRRLAHPGRVQHFVNDRNGRPLFFLLREANESFVKMIPELIRETHALIGKQQLTFVFDRGGQSGPLFKEIEKGKDLFITYKKGKFRPTPGGAFRAHQAVSVRWGKKIEKTYYLWEGDIKITGYGKARLILVKKKGHQTPIITNDWKRPAVEIVSLMFDRWSQENFFKYMCANYSIDELVTHEAHETRPVQVLNPRWLELEKKIRAARKKTTAMERGVGKLAAKGGNGKVYEDERTNPFTTKVAALKRMKTRLKKLQKEQKECPQRISPAEIGQEVQEVIPKEGKIILDTVKSAVYNVEEWLLEMMQPHYRNWRDPRPILRMILQQKGDFQVKDGVVKVTLHRFENPSYQRAARGLCQVLTDLEARSWDGKWQFEYEVAK